MIVTGLVFYLFAIVMVASALMVIIARNPVHSVLFLILAFFNSAGLFLLMGAEFLAMLMVIVYVGAVAVLFMFVVMMLDINFTQLRQGFLTYLPVGFVIGLILLVELTMVFGTWALKVDPGQKAILPAPPPGAPIGNTEAIGQLLYTHYVYLFQGAGLILLVAMIGAIVLTLRQRNIRRQSIVAQQSRTRKEAVAMVDVPVGKGVDV